MKLEVGKGNGYIIIDDNTGKVLDVFVQLNKEVFDNYIITSYRSKNQKHFKL